ncbi:hypothetical protein NEFER03_1082 [Nematocida sp. LUAm3]|nr:hypothetical protein NEFER03_1082 [Nematocida sp. LUAm3]KAI5175313.1 hypothetical protein NEFER02_1242 [Nematocida sp. LUAm2]KAI5177730.1 hypothetical protein NEFER01_0954 [Nematocida sp. LUAm1]
MKDSLVEEYAGGSAEGGEVQRKVREWEIQILYVNDPLLTKSLFQIYAELEVGLVKDSVAEALLHGIRSEEVLYQIVAKYRNLEETNINDAYPYNLSPAELPECFESHQFSELESEQAMTVHQSDPTTNQDLDMLEKITSELQKISDEQELTALKKFLGESKEITSWIILLRESIKLIKKNKGRRFLTKEQKRKVVCFECNEKGHVVKYCKKQNKSTESADKTNSK